MSIVMTLVICFYKKRHLYLNVLVIIVSWDPLTMDFFRVSSFYTYVY